MYPDSRDTGSGAEPVEVVEDGFRSQWGAVRLAEHEIARHTERGLSASRRSIRTKGSNSHRMGQRNSSDTAAAVIS